MDMSSVLGYRSEYDSIPDGVFTFLTVYEGLDGHPKATAASDRSLSVVICPSAYDDRHTDLVYPAALDQRLPTTDVLFVDGSLMERTAPSKDLLPQRIYLRWCQQEPPHLEGH